MGYFYYRKDYRIRVIANATHEAEQAWNLEIRKVKLDDEGFYLCKVMAEPQSLKQVVYLKVNVDLKLTPMNPLSIKYEDTVVITCNTSYEVQHHSQSQSPQYQHHSRFLNSRPKFDSILTTSQPNQQQPHQQPPRLMWYKDGEHFSVNDHHFTHLLPSVASNNAQNLSVNYRIEYFARPVLWSRVTIKNLQQHNVGKYTCKFKSQNVSTVISPHLAESLANMRLVDKTNALLKSTSTSLSRNVGVASVYVLVFSVHLLVDALGF